MYFSLLGVILFSQPLIKSYGSELKRIGCAAGACLARIFGYAVSAPRQGRSSIATLRGFRQRGAERLFFEVVKFTFLHFRSLSR
jgi:hypothetical protein